MKMITLIALSLMAIVSAVSADEKMPPCYKESEALKTYLQSDDQEVIPEGFELSTGFQLEVLKEKTVWNRTCEIQVPYFMFDEDQSLGMDCFVPVKVKLKKGELQILEIKREKALCFS